MKRATQIAGLVLPVCLCASLPAGAQPAAPTAGQAEKVVVTGQKLSSKAIDNFVDAYATPTLYLGKIARWKNSVCAKVTGSDLAVASTIAQRIVDVAGMVGAPVTASSGCQGNIEVNLTDAPQKLMDSVLAQRSSLLGYARGESQLRRMAKVSHPIQAWYATQWEDNNGVVRADSAMDQCGAAGIADNSNCTVAASGGGARTRSASSTKSEFFNVFITVDIGSGKIPTDVRALADYIAMLALAQTASFETCLPAPSIINLMASNCDPASKASSLTDADVAYLRGLYRVRLDKSFDQQKSDIASDMAKSVGAP